MATYVKYGKDGYGQIELNQVAWRRDGRIEAQCRPDATTDFLTDKVENGMLVAVDKVGRKVFKATAALAATNPIGIVYSSEHIYDERNPGLKSFALDGANDFLPRIGYPAVGDTFTINALSYDSDGTITTDAELETAIKGVATTPLYAGIGADGTGYWHVTTTAAKVGPIARIVAATTMPDGQFAAKLQIIKVI